jgi:hypothetical protein
VLARPAPDAWASRVPLLATLAWTDPPAQPFAARALVNDLDLVVTPAARGAAPVFGNQEPLATAPAPDRLNNVERVAFPAALHFAAGRNAAFLVVVRGASVVAAAPQNYSLVVTGPGLQLVAPALCAVPSDSPSPTPRRRAAPAAAQSSVGATVGFAASGLLAGGLVCVAGSFYCRRLQRNKAGQAGGGARGRAGEPGGELLVTHNNLLHPRRQQEAADPCAPGAAAQAPGRAAALAAADPTTPDAEEDPLRPEGAIRGGIDFF